MGEVTIHVWTLILGAAAGLAAVAGARNSLVMGAVIGAITAVVLTIARGFF